MSSGGQSSDVFFRFNLRCSVQSPQFDKLRKNLINAECVELFQEIIRVVRNIGISVFCHDVGDIFKNFKTFNADFAFVFIALSDFSFQCSKVLVNISAEFQTMS